MRTEKQHLLGKLGKNPAKEYRDNVKVTKVLPDVILKISVRRVNTLFNINSISCIPSPAIEKVVFNEIGRIFDYSSYGISDASIIKFIFNRQTLTIYEVVFSLEHSANIHILSFIHHFSGRVEKTNRDCCFNFVHIIS